MALGKGKDIFGKKDRIPNGEAVATMKFLFTKDFSHVHLETHSH